MSEVPRMGKSPQVYYHLSWGTRSSISYFFIHSKFIESTKILSVSTKSGKPRITQGKKRNMNLISSQIRPIGFIASLSSAIPESKKLIWDRSGVNQ